MRNSNRRRNVKIWTGPAIVRLMVENADLSMFKASGEKVWWGLQGLLPLTPPLYPIPYKCWTLVLYFCLFSILRLAKIANLADPLN